MNELIEHKDEKGRFLKGTRPGPGRPVGSRVKLVAQFWDDFHAVWKIEGKHVLERLVVEDPATFAKVAAMLVAKSVDEGEKSPGVTIVNVITGVRGP